MMKVTLEKFGDIIASGTLLGRIGAPEVWRLPDLFQLICIFFYHDVRY
jgi:hypothetical protein